MQTQKCTTYLRQLCDLLPQSYHQLIIHNMAIIESHGNKMCSTS